MQLADYMRINGLSDDAVGEALGVARATVSRLRRGKMVPSFDLAARIHEFTGKKVTPNDFLSAVRPIPSESASA